MAETASRSDEVTMHPVAPAVREAAVRPAAGWIMGAWHDWLLFIGPPLLIAPLVQMARTVFSVEDLTLYVLAFVATGHHLPGMMRAYGDRALFQRFKVRFLVAPVVFLTVSLVFALRDMQGLMLIVVLWGFWHGTMQVYGFMRIYDAKVRSVAPLTVWLDLLMCFAWFGAGVLFSSGVKTNWLKAYFLAGGPSFPTIDFSGVQIVWSVATLLISTAFLANIAWRGAEGRPVSPAKLLVMASSFGFWWYCMVGLDNVALGIALFEVFHDIQYLAIVWVFNCKRADQDPGVGAFTRFVFRRSRLMVGLYLFVICGYGYLGVVPAEIDLQPLKRTLFGIGIASLLLHYYYDGFIWKVRERSTRAGLGLNHERSPDVATSRFRLPGWAAHAAKWCLFVFPVALIVIVQRQGATLSLAEHRRIIATIPNSWEAHDDIALELEMAGQVDEAISHLKHALSLKPDNPQVHYRLGNLLLRQNKLIRAAYHYKRAVQLKPDYADAYCNLGTVYGLQNRLKPAKANLQRALRIKPQNAEAHHNLGLILGKVGNRVDAVKHYRAAIRIQPDFALAYYNLGVTLANQHHFDQAITRFRQAVRHQPDFVAALNKLAWYLAVSNDPLLRNPQEAVQWAEEACRLTRHQDVQVLQTLATAYAEVGRFGEALAATQHALEIARQNNQVQLVDQIQTQIEMYRNRRAH